MAECLQCSAGSHRLLSCPSLNAVCKDCVLGLNYMPEKNTQTACFPCRRECDRRGEVIVSACNRTQDSLCECKSGSYLQSPGDIACQRHKSCPPGEGVTTAGTLTSNSVCGKCEVGTFSSHLSSIQRCRPHTDCDRLGGLKRAGNSTADNLCYNSFSSAFSGLPAYGFPIIICFGVIFLLILIAIIGYCICKRLDRWSRYKHILLHGPKSKRREKSNDLGDIANDEEKEGSVFDQLTTSSANICVGSSSKTLNANSPSSFHDKTGVKDFSDFLEQSIEQGAPHPDNASVNSGIAFNNNGNNNTNLRVEPSAPPPDDLSPSSSEDNNGAG